MNSHTQVQLSNSKVKILSVPREDYWIFSSGILKLLNQSLISADEISSDSDTDSESSSLSDWSASSKHDSKFEHIGGDNNKSRHVIDVTESSISDLQKLDIEDHNNQTDEEEEIQLAQDDDGFYHVGFTPNECTIIFSERFLEFFMEAIEVSVSLGKDIKLFPDSFYLLEIAGDGLNIGKRVLEITEPLSKADISLFFLSNYFSDIVLVPASAKDKVITLLKKKGFSFANSIKSYNAIGSLSGGSDEEEDKNGNNNENDKNNNNDDDDDDDNNNNNNDDDDDNEKLNNTKTIGAEETFEKFDIHPKISTSNKLLLTGARPNDNRSIIEKIVLTLTCHPPNNSNSNFPKFFSVTKTLQDEILLLLPKSFQKYFGFNARNLVGSLNELMIPIELDLFNLPIDSKGIVSGIAKKVIKRFDELGNEDCEMSYLSMGRSSIVMIPIENIEIVKDVFQ